MALTVKSLRINVGMSRDELVEKFQELGITDMTRRKLVDRENNVSKWTGTEVVALTKIFDVKASDLNIE